MPPEPFQIVVGARRFRENVNNEVAIIHQHPIGGVKPFQAYWKLSYLLQLFGDLIRNGMSLARIARRTYDEVVGKRRNLAQV